ncbi:MAG TPA: sugar phosphate nucleotidyltransferase [Dehalococcoidia bacterium]
MTQQMSVLILCGGQGTRAYPYTKETPKALMPVGDVPIVEQVMRIYASFGYTDFVLSVGYLKEPLIEYFEQRQRELGWAVTCIDTGVKTDTGGRILGCAEALTPTFHATYCDGLGDLDIEALVEFHRSHPGSATMTTVPLRSQYGLVHFNGDHSTITHFEEKPILQDRWINAGFFVFDQEAFAHWEGANLEKEVLPAIAHNGQLHAYTHRGFWRSMDTYKDQQELNGLWEPHSRRLEALLAAEGAQDQLRGAASA